MDVRLLGPLEVDFGERVIIEAPKQRGVLETLAIFADTGVSPATLIEAIWGDGPPRTAGASLQSHVSRLRQLLPEGTITTDGQGYRLNVDPDDVDIHRFERFVIAGGQALDGDNPAHALELVDAAVRLWRGSPFDDLADGVVRAGHRARLDELWWTAREVRCAALLDLGRSESAIIDAEEVTQSQPLRERAWVHLMMALYRSGRRAEALEAYGRLRTVLRDELGVSPSAELRELDSQMLAEDPSLDAPTRAPRVVPNPSTSFVGRLALLEGVDSLLETHRLVTLVGPGGVGKSRMAIAAARSAPRDRWQHGIWWVELNGWRGDGWFVRQLVGVLGVVPPPGMTLDQALRRFVSHRSMLLVVDRAEVGIEIVARIVSQLLDAAPALTVLVTSRLPLGVQDERLVRVGPLGLEPATDRADTAEAVQLFQRRREDQLGSCPHDDPETLAELCRIVGGLPLGIELLAARAGRSSPEQVLRQLRADPRSLLEGAGPADDPHRNLTVVFDSTLELLGSSARALLGDLSVCPASFDLATAQALGGPATRSDLQRLVDAALVVGVDPGTGERRFRLPDPTRTYADSILDPDDRAAARQRHAEWFRQVMVSAGAEMVGERDVDWSKRLARDDANIRAALDWWMEHDPVRALVFANAFGRASSLHTDDVELCHLFDRMLGAASADDRIGRYPLDVARLRLRRGWPRFLTGDFEGGIDDMRCAAAMFDALSDAIGSAEAYSGLGHMIVLATADSDAASESYERAITSSREAGAPLTTAMALAEQAQSLIFADRAEVRINEMLDEAEALFRAAGDAVGIAHVMMDRTLAAYAVDDLAAVERYADEAIRSSRAGGDVAYEQISYVAKGVVRLHRRDHAGAADCLGLGVRLAVDAHNLLQLGVALHAVAVYAASVGRPDEAARLRGGAAVLAPLWPLFERRYGELVGGAFGELGESLDTEMAAGAELDLGDLRSLSEAVLALR